MSNIFSKTKVAADVIDDEGDYLEAQVALYYDNDPDDPTPLFGDASPDAVDTERMLQEDMMNAMPNAGKIYANINRIQCAAFTAMEEAKREIEKGMVRYNGPTAAGKDRTEEADDFWPPWVEVYEEMLEVPGMFKTDARKKVAARMAKEGAWVLHRPKSKRDRPGKTALKDHLE